MKIKGNITYIIAKRLAIVEANNSTKYYTINSYTDIAEILREINNNPDHPIELGMGSIFLEEFINQVTTIVSASFVTDLTICNNLNIRSKEGIKIAEALKTNCTLTHLYLDGNNIGEEGAIKITEALKTNRTLTHLYLDGNNIGQTGAIKISEMLKNNQTMAYLSLSLNNIRTNGVAALTEALKTNRSLTHLYLDGNNIGEEGGERLAAMLKSQYALTYLGLSGNKIGTRLEEKIQSYTKRNWEYNSELANFIIDNTHELTTSTGCIIYKFTDTISNLVVNKIPILWLNSEEEKNAESKNSNIFLYANPPKGAYGFCFLFPHVNQYYLKGCLKDHFHESANLNIFTYNIKYFIASNYLPLGAVCKSSYFSNLPIELVVKICLDLPSPLKYEVKSNLKNQISQDDNSLIADQVLQQILANNINLSSIPDIVDISAIGDNGEGTAHHESN